MKRLMKPLFFLLIILSVSLTAFPQGFHTEFGKSKVQYEKFDWYFYRTKNFEVYYHEGGKNLAQYVLTYSDLFLEEVESKLDYRVGERITLVIYNTYSDYKQSNITLTDEQYNTGGLTTIVNNIGFVYFDGNHIDFDKRIKSAIAEVILNEAIFGSSIQHRIQNATLISLPDWYYYSLVKYISGNWTKSDELKLKEGIENDDFKKFGKLTNDEKLLIGHSLWDYVYDVYGENAMSNILYMVRINKNIESGFNYILGKTFKQVYTEWYKYIRYKYNSIEVEKFEELHHLEEIKRFAKDADITRIKLSPRADKIAYVTNKKGKVKVYVYDFDSRKKKVIFKSGYKQENFHEDYNYPIIDWHPRNNAITIAYEKKSIPYLIDYDFEKNKKTNKVKMDRVDKILDMDYDELGKNLVLSAIKNGSSDIFIFQVRSNRLFPITNDIFDDLNPRYVNNSKGIVFSSNRKNLKIERTMYNPETSFNQGYDVFYYDAINKSRRLKQITFTPNINEIKPAAYDSFYFSYLTDENGITNRNAAYLDSIFQKIQVVVNYTDSNTFKNDTFNFFQNDISIVQYNTKTYFDTIVSEKLDRVEVMQDTLVPDISYDSIFTFDTVHIENLAEVFSIDTAIIYKDTAYSYKLTNYATDILDYDIKEKSTFLIELYRTEKSYKLAFFHTPLVMKESTIGRIPQEDIYKKLKKITDDNLFEKEEPKEKKESVKYETETFMKQSEPDSFEYLFLNQYDIKKIDSASDKKSAINFVLYSDEPATVPDLPNKHKGYSKTKYGASSMYFLSFTPDYLVSQIDNSYLQTPYLPFSASDPITPFNQGANAFIMLGISDHFGDYKINGGFRFKSNLNGAEYIMNFENLKSRLDKKVTFYRNTETTEDLYVQNQFITNEGRLQLRYPFSEFASIRGDAFIRQDRDVTLGSERQSLAAPDELNAFIGSKFEFVFDNTIPLSKNLYSGTRFKAYFENFRHLNDFKSEFSVYGLDYRNYIKIHKEFIWANRISFASSIGNSKVSFFLGGVDNWLFPKINSEIQVDPEVNYIYRSLAVNMRGFTQNIRNGNSYAVINSELRLPVVKYFSSKPVRSSFWENFQVIGFADIGTAWTGLHPYDDGNSLNKRIIDKNPFYITVITVGEPIVGGYGFGIRSELFGYFVRLDRAYGVEGFKKFGKITYLSLGLDF